MFPGHMLCIIFYKNIKHKLYEYKIQQLLWMSLCFLSMSMNVFHLQSNVSTSFTVDSWILVMFRFSDPLISLNLTFFPFEVDSIKCL